MRVKIGELKAHFSKYLRQIGETGHSIEVCAREEPVAYLTPAKGAAASTPDRSETAERLASAGVIVSQWGSDLMALGSGGKAEAPLGGPNSIETMRQEKNW